uniref:Uncharacterized protein n=1 Tax=Rhipicephalus zambeziensis TaxID=60191 RepID=A0A224YTC2_9ACAR
MAGGKAGKDSGKAKAKAVSRSARAGLQTFNSPQEPVSHRIFPVRRQSMALLGPTSHCCFLCAHFITSPTGRHHLGFLRSSATPRVVVKTTLALWIFPWVVSIGT